MTFVPASSIGGGSGGGLTDAELRATPVPISGSFLTDAQLRASAVPISGNVGIIGTPNVGAIQITSPWQVQGGLTDAELRALPVPVSGPLTDAELRASDVGVTGPLTDAELRATPLDVPDGAATESTLSEVALTAIMQRERLETE